MIRTNQSFLDYTQHLYKQQNSKENIILKSYSGGQKLLQQNEKANKVMLIKEGITKCFFTENNDKEYIVEFLGKGEIIGELECIQNISCLCNVEAMTNVSVYAFAVPYFKFLLKNDLQLNELLVNAFTTRIINTSSRASFQQLYTAEQSLSKLIHVMSEQEISLSKEEMAAYLGISVRSLNRALKSLLHK